MYKCITGKKMLVPTHYPHRETVLAASGFEMAFYHPWMVHFSRFDGIFVQNKYSTVLEKNL